MLLECLICARPRSENFDFCESCGRALLRQVHLESGLVEQRGLQIMTLARYEGPFKIYLSLLKRRPSHWRLSTQRSLRLLIQHSPLPIDDGLTKAVCPVPSSRIRELSSFSLSLSVAHELSILLKIPLLHPLPKRNFLWDLLLETDQKFKNSRSRTVQPSPWVWPKTLQPKAPQKILLVDDVITSGTSLAQLKHGLSMRSYQTSRAFCLLRSKHCERPS